MSATCGFSYGQQDGQVHQQQAAVGGHVGLGRCAVGVLSASTDCVASPNVAYATLHVYLCFCV